ncbi:MAG TPA: hypothetical protein VGP92_09260 [Acidimicrobiia bacterium]|nr:hypothetical protein [Acidimicrobiia bacterium]
MHSRVFRVPLIALGAIFVLAGCGGSSGSASAGSGATTTTAKAGAAGQTAFRDCLAQHGITLPAGAGNGRPPGSGQGGGGGTPRSLPAGVDAQKFQAALTACGRTGGRGFGGGANSPAFQAYTSCLSDHGVKVPPRTASSTPPTFDRTSATFVAANKVCAALLPSRTNTTTTTKPSN